MNGIRLTGCVLSFAGLLLITVATPIFSQNTASSATGQQKSLADTVRETKAGKTAKATKVFTDDDETAFRKSPLPQLNLDGDDNSDEILDAILKYQASHKPEETEKAVHDWYDETDGFLANAIHDSIESRNLRQSNLSNSYEMCQSGGDYEQCAKRRQAEMRGARLDAQRIQQDGQRVGRIQQAFLRIRAGLQRNQLRYSWFKVRNANGVGSF
jgi:hypothetical protein